MTARTVIGAVVVAAACAAGGAGCGDSKGPSKADYLAKAKAVCQRGNAALTAASQQAIAKVPPGEKLSGPAIEEFVRNTVVPTIRNQIKELRAIEAPKGEKGHVEEIYAELDKGLDELEKAPAKLTDGSNVFATADTLAQKYGISVCATTG
jgi:hypothetical protein